MAAELPPLGKGQCPLTPHRAYRARDAREKAGWLQSYRRSATGLAARGSGVDFLLVEWERSPFGDRPHGLRRGQRRGGEMLWFFMECRWLAEQTAKRGRRYGNTNSLEYKSGAFLELGKPCFLNDCFWLPRRKASREKSVFPKDSRRGERYIEEKNRTTGGRVKRKQQWQKKSPAASLPGFFM